MKLATTTGDFERFLPDHCDRVKAVAAAGFKYVDLSFYNEAKKESVYLQPDWMDYVKKLKETADECGVTFVQSHAPDGNPMVKDGNYEILLESTRRTVEVCGMLGIPNTVIHTGCTGEMDIEKYCKINLEFFDKLYDVAEKNNVYLLCENTTHANTGKNQFIYTGKDIKMFSEMSGHPLVGGCWDTGHANCEGRQYEHIMDMGKYFKAIHFNDNRGQRDEHIAPFMGTLCVDEVMNGIIDSGFEGSFTFECDSTLRPFKYWLGDRNDYCDKKHLISATLEMQNKLEELLYVIGKGILDSYGLWEA